MADNLIELNRHDSTVGSVISRLHRHQGRIKSITAIIEWDNETIDISCNAKKTRDFTYELAVFGNYVDCMIEDGKE